MNFFEFNDYKLALKAFVKVAGKRYGSNKKIAEHLGVHASLVSQILSGPRDFTEEQLFSICEYLGVPKLEFQYLLVLLQIERAGTQKLRNHYVEQKEALRKQSLQVKNRILAKHELSEIECAKFYSSWIYSAVHLLTTLEKKVSFEFICQRFNLPPAKLREILNFLIQIQMISEEGGFFRFKTAMTHLEKKSPFVVKHHTNWRLKAIDAAESLSDEELIYSLNFSVSKHDFMTLREDLIHTIQKFLSVVKDSPAEDIAQFNVDLFWIK